MRTNADDKAGRAANARRHRKGQVAVLDRGLAAVVGAAALLGILGTYIWTKADTAADAEITQINSLTAAVTRLYDGRTNTFTGLDEKVLAATGNLPDMWLDGTKTTIVSTFHTPVTVTTFQDPASGLVDGAYRIRLSNVPTPACVVLATTPFTAKMIGTNISANALWTMDNPLSDPAAASQACFAAAVNGTVPSVEFLFR